MPSSLGQGAARREVNAFAMYWYAAGVLPVLFSAVFRALVSALVSVSRLYTRQPQAFSISLPGGHVKPAVLFQLWV